MPATNYNWPFSEEPPIFSVYGTKRKNCTDDSSQDVVEEMETKRRCTESRPGTDEVVMTDGMDISGQRESQMNHSHLDQTQVTFIQSNSESQNHPFHHHDHQHHHQTAMNCNTSIQNLAQHHLQVTMNNRVPPLPDQTGDHRHDNNNTILHTGERQELNNNFTPQRDLDIQSDMLMDLNEGVYSTSTLPLNPQTDAEYEAACSMMAAMEGEGAPDPRQYSMSYCDQHCVGGDLSPNSRRVRCACRPSWEGLTDVRPYVSDYY